MFNTAQHSLAVVLDLVDPVLADGWCLAECRELRLDQERYGTVCREPPAVCGLWRAGGQCYTAVVGDRSTYLL
jgi:hypothetical protein